MGPYFFTRYVAGLYTWPPGSGPSTPGRPGQVVLLLGMRGRPGLSGRPSQTYLLLGGSSLSGRPGQAVCLCSPSPRPSGYGKGRHGKSRQSLEDDPLICEKKIVNCLRHETPGMSGFFLQGGYLPVPDLRAQLKMPMLGMTAPVLTCAL